MTNIKCTNKKAWSTRVKELTAQSRKRKIKFDNDFLEFYKPYKNVKQT